MVVSLETVDDDVLIVEGQLKSYTFFSESKRSEYKRCHKEERAFLQVSHSISRHVMYNTLVLLFGQIIICLAIERRSDREGKKLCV